MRCLEKHRTRRYETANGLARDVERYLKDEPVEACPPTAGYKLRKFARKYKAGLATAAGFAALLLLGTVVSAWQAVRATQAEGVANANADGTARVWEAAALAEGMKGKLTIDPTKQPKTMEWSALKPEDEKKLNLKGIYEIEGATLKFCYGEPQPTEFKTKPNRQPNGAPIPNLDQRMFVLEREKR
jgi:uncharacterized protein (TIGR03067 family)